MDLIQVAEQVDAAAEEMAAAVVEEEVVGDVVEIDKLYNMKITYDPLWQKINAFPLDHLSFKLSQENNWDITFMERAVTEYKYFIYLCCALPNGVSPSPVVETVWQIHMLYTENYWEEFCEKTLRKKLHYYPREEPIEKSRLRETRQHYKLIFGEDPPKDIWRGAKHPGRKINFTFRTRWALPFFLLSYAVITWFNGEGGPALAFALFGIIFFIISRAQK